MLNLSNHDLFTCTDSFISKGNYLLYTFLQKTNFTCFFSRMASQSEGIQRLLEAEKEAQKDIDAARRRKLKFLVFVNCFFFRKLRIELIENNEEFVTMKILI